ncbi:hypothetical protein NFI96_014082, partial [Prochilodus magdalenae]
MTLSARETPSQTTWRNTRLVAAAQLPATDQEKPTLQDIQSNPLPLEHSELSGLNQGEQVKAVLPQQADQPFHDHKPGDWVLIRDLRRRRWNQPRWTGPHQVLLVTHTAVKVEERGTWVHHMH